jgi:exoribonuclease-2
MRGQRAPFARNSDALLGALRAFEVVAARYDEHQRAMEHYWCLRWLAQEQLAEADGTVLRESLVRLDGMPLVLRVPSLPALDPGSRVRLALEPPDLIERQVHAVWRASLGQAPL